MTLSAPQTLLGFFHPGKGPLSPIKLISTIVKKKNGPTASTHPHLQKLSYADITWTIIRYPQKEDQGYLKRHFGFHPLHLDDILSPIQRPKTDFEENYIFSVFHFPEFNSESKKIESNEIDFFITDKDIILIAVEEFLPLEDFVKALARNDLVRKRYFEKGTGVLFYHIVDHLVDSIFPLLDQLEKGLELIDTEVFSRNPRNVTEQLSFLRRNVIFFQTLVKPELNAFSILEESTHPLIDKNTKTYFGNISDHFRKIWDRLEDIKELTDNLAQTFESYLSYKTNETIKVLTIFSVILLPLNLLAGIYGMNLTYLPFANNPFALIFISIIMLAIVILMLTFFQIKHWV